MAKKSKKKVEKKTAKAKAAVSEKPARGKIAKAKEKPAEIAAPPAPQSAGPEGAATAAGKTENTAAANTSASFKNFRHHPDMENFYRFIYENDLRFEALKILDQIMAEKNARKRIRAARSRAH